jgi:hypothetical protein
LNSWRSSRHRSSWLAEQPLLDTAKYLATQGALLSIAFIPTPAGAPADWPFLAYPVFAVAGVYYCYKRNGGAAGERFAERYLAVGWVAGMRVALGIVVVVLACVVGLAFTDRGLAWLEDSQVAASIDVGVLTVTALVYWRMGIHLADVHRLTARRDPGTAPPDLQTSL